MIPAGTHVGKATGAFDFGTAKTGTEQVAVEFEFLEGEVAGQCRTWFGYFTDASKQRTVEALRYAGWQGDDIAKLEGLGSRRVNLVVEHERGEDGKVREKIAWVNRFGGAGVVKLKQPMDEKQRRQFAAKMKSFAASVPALPPEEPAALQRQTEPPAKGSNGEGIYPPEPEGDAPPHGDDEIPF